MLRKLKIYFLNTNKDQILNRLLVYLDDLFKNTKTEIVNGYTIIRSVDEEFIICYNNFDVNLNVKILLKIELLCKVDMSEASNIFEYYISQKISNKIIGEKNIYVCTTELINIYIEKEKEKCF